MDDPPIDPVEIEPTNEPSQDGDSGIDIDPNDVDGDGYQSENDCNDRVSLKYILMQRDL